MVKSEFDDCFQNGNYDALRPYHVDNAIILAAGMCSRFKPLSDTKPKAFLKVKGEILIERMIRQLSRLRFRKSISWLVIKKKHFLIWQKNMVCI